MTNALSKNKFDLLERICEIFRHFSTDRNKIAQVQKLQMPRMSSNVSNSIIWTLCKNFMFKILPALVYQMKKHNQDLEFTRKLLICGIFAILRMPVRVRKTMEQSDFVWSSAQTRTRKTSFHSTIQT